MIDEIQYAPQLFPQLKLAIDRRSEKRLFFLSGSQQFHMMKMFRNHLLEGLELLLCWEFLFGKNIA